MKIKTYRYFIPILVLTLSFGVIQGQKARVANADKKYNNYAYLDAIATYEQFVLF
jgi:hypothetical protein